MNIIHFAYKVANIPQDYLLKAHPPHRIHLEKGSLLKVNRSRLLNNKINHKPFPQTALYFQYNVDFILS